jgi:hypothetical protein
MLAALLDTIEYELGLKAQSAAKGQGPSAKGSDRFVATTLFVLVFE